MYLVEGEQAGKGLAALLQLAQGCICPLLLQGALAGLVHGHHTIGVAAPLLEQLLEEGLVPDMQAAAAQPCTPHSAPAAVATAAVFAATLNGAVAAATVFAVDVHGWCCCTSTVFCCLYMCCCRTCMLAVG